MPSRKKQVENEMATLASDRKAKLMELIQSGTSEDIRQVLLSSLADLEGRFPEKVREKIEKRAEKMGEVTVAVLENFEKKEARIIFSLKDEVGENLQLHFVNSPQVGTGVTIRVQGILFDKDQLVSEGEGAAGSSTSSVQVVSTSSTAGAAGPTGDQQTLVLTVNFTNASLGCSNAWMDSAVFTNPTKSVNFAYRESSFGLTGFAGMVAGPFTIPYTNSCISNWFGTWSSAADNEAAKAGITLSNYPRRLYVVSSGDLCGYGGYSTIGGNPSVSMIGYCSHPDVSSIAMHELGHALGMRHASTATDIYGDHSDPMGHNWYSLLSHNNAPHKFQMGWLPASRIQTISSGGTYTIPLKLLETSDGSGIQMVKIDVAGTSSDYYVGFRRPVGTFESTYLNAEYRDRTSIHKWDGYNNTYLLQSLAVGQTFNDSTNGITITPVSQDATTAMVSVTRTGSTTCTKAAPTMTISPSTQTNGSPFFYDVTINNRDSAGCPSLNFSLTGTIQTGWFQYFSFPTLNVDPGFSATTTWTIYNTSGSENGSYSITATATATDGRSASALATAILLYDRTAPTVNLTNPVDGSTVSGMVTVAASASDDVGVSYITLVADGNAIKTCSSTTSCSASWDTTVIPLGSHILSATALDAIGNQGTSPSRTVFVVAPEMIPPSVSITSPQNGSVVGRNTTVNITASASDNVGVARVEFLVNGSLVCTDTAAAYSCAWKTSGKPKANYTLVAKAYDAAGNNSSSSVQVKT